MTDEDIEKADTLTASSPALCFFFLEPTIMVSLVRTWIWNKKL
jgi:hypothetical protein